MKTEFDAERVTVMVGETDRWHSHSLYEAIVAMLHAEGVAGATVVKGTLGYGESSRMHAAHLLDLSSDLPMMIVFVDTAENVARVMPKLDEMVGSGLVVVEAVRVAKYSRG
ncbi:MAG: DUF190 domain-containing protein [Coriobacteriia bacterium]|nr:DUF190 domain-containing protein [Coriobacteriia bacterium]